ncbi:ATP-dependent DNA helicase [Lachnospiraceae bacterium TWA4]|nr:ATP-dependent DNA helicase [Lachnospiraceae bacterium TWA4]
MTFDFLQKKLKESIQIDSFNKDTLKTLSLYNNTTGYNNTASLLADENNFPGVDIVKFGDDISIIQKRVTIENKSLLKIYEEAIDVFRDYYQYEEIHGVKRKKIEKIPEAAFCEAIANALIHRAWDMESQIRVLMFDDRVEVISPGGLPSGITKEEYLTGMISVLRNRNLANVFYRLGFVEIFGTGIIRIQQLYKEGIKKPEFEVTDNTIKIVLPILKINLSLTEDERKIYELLSKTTLKSMSEIVPYIDFGKSKITKLLKDMVQKGVVEIHGKGKGTKYTRT